MKELSGVSRRDSFERNDDPGDVFPVACVAWASRPCHGEVHRALFSPSPVGATGAVFESDANFCQSFADRVRQRKVLARAGFLP